MIYEQQKSYYDLKWLNFASRKMGEDEIGRIEFIIASIIKLKSGINHRLRIIDLGCGRGWITDVLSRYGDVVGTDLSTSAAERLYPHLKFFQANIVTDEIEGKYNIVVSSDVIEHLSFVDQQVYVRKAQDLLNEGEYLILTTPNKPKAENLLKESCITKEQLQPIENWLDKRSLSLLLSPYFEVTYIGSTVFHPLLIRKHKYLNRVYIFCYIYLKLYKFVDILLRSSLLGLYLTVVAQKRTMEYTP